MVWAMSKLAQLVYQWMKVQFDNLCDVTTLILPRCAVNRRRPFSGELTLSRLFRVQGFFDARWVRRCCLVSWPSLSLKIHLYWRLNPSSCGHLQPIHFSFCVQILQVILNIFVEKSGFGIIFGGGLSSFLAAGHCHARFPTIEQVKPVPNLAGTPWLPCFEELHLPSHTWRPWYADPLRILRCQEIWNSKKH